MEGRHKFTSGNLKTFSTQQLIDCMDPKISYGCGGGRDTHAYKYYTNKDALLADTYPYDACYLKCRHEEEQMTWGGVRAENFFNVA